MSGRSKSIHRRRWLAALAVVLVATAGSAEERSARDWLQGMAEAARNLDYHGVFVYRTQNSLQAMRIVHKGSGRSERERLVSLNGTAREIVRKDDRVTYILPDAHSVVVARRRVANAINSVLPADLDGLERFYEFELAEGERVAGREAQWIAIKPRDNHRYGYEFWIDRESGLLLRCELLDESGSAIEQLMFTQLNLTDRIPTDWLQPSITGDDFTWYRQPKRDGGQSPDEEFPWRVTGLPPGFTLRLSERRRMAGSDTPVEHRLYSDGLASVSVYLEPRDKALALVGGVRMGAIHAFGRTLDGYQSVVVGEVPASTARRIAESIVRQPRNDK